MASANTTDSWSRDHVADANPELPRKRERLSEEKDDASPPATDDSIVVEALPVEQDDAGNSYETAIELHDDAVMDPFSADFELQPNSGLDSVDQLKYLINTTIPQGMYLEPHWIDNLCTWLESHVNFTREMPDRWRNSYLHHEREFFELIGRLSRDMLAHQGDFFHTRTLLDYGSDRVGKSLLKFYSDITELSCRILHFLPDVVDNMVARRDSGQLPKTRQSLELLSYVEVLAKTTALHKAISRIYLKDTFRHMPKQGAKHRMEECLARPGFISDLLALLQKLTQNHRDISNAWEGIDSILHILRAREMPKLSTEQLRTIMDVVHHGIMPLICEKHPRALPENFHEYIVETAVGVLEELTKDASNNEGVADLYERYVKGENDALIPQTTQAPSLAAQLCDLSCDDRSWLAELMTTAWSLQALRSFIYSDIMDVRTCGIQMLSNRLLALYNDHKASSEFHEHPTLQYVARFMRTNELTKYIFGPNSHASLVCHSGSIIGFLAAIAAYTHLETDIIWHACTNSAEVEFAKASLSVLSEICRYLDLGQLLYVANKYVNTPPSKLGNDAVDSLTDLFQKVQLKSGEASEQDHRLATAHISIDVMLKADEAEPNSALSRLRDIAKQELRRFSAPPFLPRDRLEIYLKCAPHITVPSVHATTAIDIILLFLRVPMVDEEASDLLKALSVHDAVHELGHFVQACGEGTVLVDKIRLAAIELRLELFVRLWSISGGEVDDEDIQSFFNHAVGDRALNTEMRECAWRALLQMLKLPRIATTASNLLQRFLAQEIPSLALEYFTPELISICGVRLQEQLAGSKLQSDYSSTLRTPMWEKLVQAAESTENPQVSQQAAQMICKVLFEASGQHQTGASAAEYHSAFARQQIDRICNEYRESSGANIASICQKLGLLDAVLFHSREVASQPGSSSLPDVSLATDPEVDIVQYTLRIHGTGQTQPKTCVLRAKKSNTLSELVAKLPSATGAADNRVIIGGKELDLSADGEMTLDDMGIPTSGVIPIAPKHTSESDLGLVLTSPGAVEGEVLEHYGDLQELLEGPNQIASQTYVFLTKVRPPIQTRQHVASPDTPVKELCPLDKPWRCAFSFYVLKTNLADFARIGVADEAFILQGLRVLLAVITDKERPDQMDVMIWALDCLIAFLLEQPQLTSTTMVIEEPACFASRMVELCMSALQLPSLADSANQRMNLASFALKALLQACRRQRAVWICFANESQAGEVFQQAMFHPEPAFAQLAIQTILSSCSEGGSSAEVADFFMKALLEVLPQAQVNKDRATQYFELLTQVLLANSTLRSDEARAREITESLILALWNQEHIESVDLPIADTSMVGLLRLLSQAINILKSFKKPLHLEGFSTKLFTTLLFPRNCREPTSRPLLHVNSRKVALELVKTTCEGLDQFMEVLDAASIALQEASPNPNQHYPGRAIWLRQVAFCAGLPNLGMTCYMNSLLQQLFANVHFRKFLFEVPIVDPPKQELLYQVQVLFANMQDSYNLQPRTDELAKVLNIQTDSQEDVHGFYEDFLSRLESNMPDATWKVGLSKFFTGKLISQIKGECGHVSPKFEPFVDLPVNVKNKTCLPESLEEFVQGEPMEGANKYKCLACDEADGGRLVNAMRRACPDEMPDNLTFCLKRFTFEAMFGMEGKVNDRFEFPQTIDMSQYQRARLESPTSPPAEDPFELVGVIVHQGTLNLGHYWSYTLLRNTLRPDLRTWVKLEDKNVTLVEGGVQEVQHECFGGRYTNGHERADNAYVLFYQRRSSLEQQLALPGLVLDPNSGMLLQPKVPTHPNIQAMIHDNNAWSQRIAHLFDDDFGILIEWLLSKYGKAELTSPVDSVLEPSDDDSSTMAESPKESISDQELAQKITKTAMDYIKRVAVCSSTPGAKLKRCIGALEPLINGPGQHALLLLEDIANDTAWYTALIRHDNRVVRTWINNLIIKCSLHAREHDPSAHDEVFGKLRQIHESFICSATNDLKVVDWSSYLKLVTTFASFGPRETASVLEEFYWNWVFEMLAVLFEDDVRKKHPGLFEHMRHNASNVAALYQFIYEILNGHTDFSNYRYRLQEDEPRTISEDGVLLRNQEFGDLVSKSEDSSVLWIIRAAKFADKGQDWKDSAPGKLLGLLVSNKADPNLRRVITESLIEHIDIEEDSLSPILHLVTNFYANAQHFDDSSGAVFQHLVKVVHMWDGYELEFIATVQEVYRHAPLSILASLDTWVTKHLLYKHSSVRDATAKWLLDDVYGQGPLTDNQPVDQARIHLARRLTDEWTDHLLQAYRSDRARWRYERMIDVVLQVEKYLKQVMDVAAEAGEQAIAWTPLQHELDEVSYTIRQIEALELDVLANWSPSTGGAGVPLSAGSAGANQEAHAGVEDEELESDDEWDGSDDDSVMETTG